MIPRRKLPLWAVAIAALPAAARAATCGNGGPTGNSVQDGGVSGPGQCGEGHGYNSSTAAEACADVPADNICDLPQSECCMPLSCGSVVDLDGATAVGGSAAVANANAPFEGMGIAVAGDPFVHGLAVSVPLLSSAMTGTFACAAGWEIDTSAAFKCTIATGAATLSAQPCKKSACTGAEVANSDKSAAAALTGVTGDTVTVACANGYEGGGTWTCGTDGSFSGTACTEVVAGAEAWQDHCADGHCAEEEEETVCEDPNGNACPPGCCSGEGYSLCSAYDSDRDESLGGPGPDYDGAGCVVENAVAQFYGVFGVIILLTVLIFFLKNNCGGSEDVEAAP